MKKHKLEKKSKQLPKIKKAKRVYVYNEQELDSEEELQFCYWLDELKSARLIMSWEKFTKSNSLNLLKAKSFEFQYGVDKKGKPQTTRFRQFIADINYTPDFNISWSTEAEGIFYLNINHAHAELTESPMIKYSKEQITNVPFMGQPTWSIVDVKGEYAGKNNSSAIWFPYMKKLMWHIHKTFVHKIVPKQLFEQTFVPTALLFNKNGSAKKYDFPIRTLREYYTLAISRFPKQKS